MAIFTGGAGNDTFTGDQAGKNTFSTGSAGNDTFVSVGSDDVYIVGGEGVFRYLGSLLIQDSPSGSNRDIIDLTAFVAAGADPLTVSTPDEFDLVLQSGGATLKIDDLLGSQSRSEQGYTFRFGGTQVIAKDFTTSAQYQSLLDGLIEGTNRAPLVTGETSQRIEKNGAAVFFLDEIAKDQDGDVVSFQIPQQVRGGTAVIDGFNRLVFTPDAGKTGDFTISITASDIFASRSFDLAVTVTGTPPEANDDAVRGTAKKLLKGLKIDVLKNDTSELGKKGLDKTTLEVIGEAEHGSVSVVKGKLVYVVDGAFDGTDSIGYRVADKTGLFSDVATVVITGPDLSGT